MRVLALAIALLCGLSVARAEDKPWAEGVPAEKQQEALAIYQRANTFFEQARYKEALAQYEQALALWDHPAIRYNAAVCLINLDRPVEAYEHLVAALRHGEAPLGKELHQQGQSYQKALAGQVAELEVRSTEPGAKISLDGKHLFVAPGSATKLVSTTDEHQLVAEKPGYQTETRTLRLAPGKHAIAVDLVPLAEGGRLERRWARYKPFAVIATGALVAGAGGLFYLRASDQYERFDAAVATLCPMGCADGELAARAAMQPDAALRDDAALDGPARRNAILAYSAFAIGGAAVAAGVALAFLNQPRLVPVTSGDRVGLVLSATW